MRQKCVGLVTGEVLVGGAVLGVTVGATEVDGVAVALALDVTDGDVDGVGEVVVVVVGAANRTSFAMRAPCSMTPVASTRSPAATPLTLVSVGCVVVVVVLMVPVGAVTGAETLDTLFVTVMVTVADPVPSVIVLVVVDSVDMAAAALVLPATARVAWVMLPCRASDAAVLLPVSAARPAAFPVTFSNSVPSSHQISVWPVVVDLTTRKCLVASSTTPRWAATVVRPVLAVLKPLRAVISARLVIALSGERSSESAEPTALLSLRWWLKLTLSKPADAAVFAAP